MPHKHTRKGEVDKSTVDLPPTIIAKPLPVSKSSKENGIFTTDLNTVRKSNKKRKRKDDTDDTPKAFARLMAFQRGEKLPKGLDDGVKLSKAEKKRKVAAEKEKEKDSYVVESGNKALKTQDVAKEVPTIRPGERMSEFSARVDAALPVSGLINKSARGGKDPLGLKVGRTKTEKRMHKMYDDWRVEEARRKEKRQEAAELAEEEEMDEDGQVKWKVDIEQTESNIMKGKKKGSKKKRKKLLGEVEDGEDDPWAKIKKDRGEEKVAFNDVVQAPPEFKKVPREIFKLKGGAKVVVGDVPRASGSLRRREELGSVRQGVVEGYRALMRERAAGERISK